MRSFQLKIINGISFFLSFYVFLFNFLISFFPSFVLFLLFLPCLPTIPLFRSFTLSPQSHFPFSSIYSFLSHFFHLFFPCILVPSTSFVHRLSQILKPFSIFDFKLSLCFICSAFSFGYLPGVWVLKADVSEHCIGSVFIGRSMKYFIDRHMKMEPIECSETSAFSTQTPGRYTKKKTHCHFHSLLRTKRTAISIPY